MTLQPVSVVDLVARGTLDPELAAHLWLLLEGSVSLVVAGDGSPTQRTLVLDALLDAFGGSAAGAPLRLGDLSISSAPFPTDIRGAIRAAGQGAPVAATIAAGSLEDVFKALRRRPIGATDDELSGLGIVLVADEVEGHGTRVLAAHYVRPVARDAHGHVQRLAPAVLATLDGERDAFEHFAWGIVPELAFRVGRRAGDYEQEHERRAGFLVGLTHASVTARADVRRAIAAYAVTPAAVTV